MRPTNKSIDTSVSSRRHTKTRAALGVLAVLAAVAYPATPAMAGTSTTICIPNKAETPVVAGTEQGTCKSTRSTTYDTVKLPAAGGLEALAKILPHMAYTESGVDGKPTLTFSGINVEVNSGAGKTNAAVNGEGNLVIGYDEDSGTERGHPGDQGGSNNLILGEEQEFTSYGGIVAGELNNIRAPFASVLDGGENTASGIESAILGGVDNTASWYEATISGGARNRATATEATVGGGYYNTADGDGSVVSGGSFNAAEESGWIGGGYKNTAAGLYSAIFGGKELQTTNAYETKP
jgi:hypothetical protein